MGSPEMGATSVNGNRWWGTDKKPGQVRSPKVRYVCAMQRPIPFSCKTERVNERAGGSACLSAPGCVPRRAALGLCWIFCGTRCAQGAGCNAEVPFPRSYTALVHARQSNSLVLSSHPCYQARGLGGTGFDGGQHRYNPSATQDDLQAHIRVLYTSSLRLQPPILMYLQPGLIMQRGNLGDWPNAPRFSSLPQYLSSTLHYSLDYHASVTAVTSPVINQVVHQTTWLSRHEADSQPQGAAASAVAMVAPPSRHAMVLRTHRSR